MTFDEYFALQMQDEEFKKVHNRNKPKYRIFDKLADLTFNDEDYLKQVARNSGLSIKRIIEIEEGDEPSAYELSSLAGALNISY